MSLLRNPVVVGILSVAAVGLVVYQTMGQKIFRRGFAEKKLEMGSAQPQAPAPAAPAHIKSGSVAVIPAATFTNLEDALLPSKGVETATVQRQFKTWVSAPLRDPFLLLQPAAGGPALLDQTNSPVRTWRLAAIWNQTGSRLAVISVGSTNSTSQKVYKAGDIVVDNYKVLRIEKDEVWIQGPHQNERLGFTSTTPVISPKPPTASTRTVSERKS